MVTDRAQDARISTRTGRLEPPGATSDRDEPLFGRPDQLGVDHTASPGVKRTPEVRVDEAAIAQPAPRRALSPAEALHLARGTTPRAEQRITAVPSPEYDPTERIQPVNRTGRAERIDRTERIDLTERDDSIDPTDRTERIDPTERTERDDPSGAGGERPA